MSAQALPTTLENIMVAALHEALYVRGVRETDAVPSVHFTTGELQGTITLDDGSKLLLTLRDASVEGGGRATQ